MFGSRWVLSKDMGGVGNSASRIASQFCKYSTLLCVCMSTCTCKRASATIGVLIRVEGRELLQLIPIKVLFMPPPCSECPHVIKLSLTAASKYNALIPLTRAYKKELSVAEAWIKSLHKSSVAGGLWLSVALFQTVEVREWESERWGGEWRSVTARSLISPFECKAVIYLIAGAELQHQSVNHCLLGMMWGVMNGIRGLLRLWGSMQTLTSWLCCWCLPCCFALFCCCVDQILNPFKNLRIFVEIYSCYTSVSHHGRVCSGISTVHSTGLNSISY